MVIDLISKCMNAHQFAFKREYLKILKIKDIKIRDTKLAVLEKKIAHSIKVRNLRILQSPKISYPELPIVLEKHTILETIKENPVVIIAGDTGSGKTTQLPKMLLEAGFGINGLIGHTQPRRIAVRTVASRIAHELESPLGEVVGYKVRFSDKTKSNTLIKVMTDGILLAETQKDKWLNEYDCIIIDEAHERSLNIDFLLGYLKQLQKKRHNLKIIVTSATIDLERFSRFFDNAPIIEVSGRLYPVQINYQEESDDVNSDPISKVIVAVEQAILEGSGDILIFQSGEKEILDVIDALKAKRFSNVTYLALYARQSVKDQQKIFESSKDRKIIVCTNVAETSITVPNIRYVIDSGFARISRYQYKSKLQRLPIEPISQASADQRKGRCGRIGPGICYRLYTREDFQNRPQFTEPEILRTSLAGVLLKMSALNLSDIERFPFIEPPDPRQIKDGYALLERLKAINDQKKITPLGQQLAKLPIEPKFGSMLIAANQLGALKELLIIVSGLTIIDPRERPIDLQEKADIAHQQFSHECSDFMSLLNVWSFFSEQKRKLSHRQFRLLCRTNFLSFVRVCEWLDIHQQLREITKELGFRENQIPADYSIIHRAILTGLLDHIGLKQENKEYLGARNTKFFVHPASALFKKSPLWLVSCEIVHTTKVYARMNAQIEPKWIEEIGSFLVKRECFEPHFEPTKGNVVAFERVTLFGLEISNRRRISFERICPQTAREIFIQQGLVEQNMKMNCAFYKKNQRTIQYLIDLEDQTRRTYHLIDDAKIYAFYNKRLPDTVFSTRSLEMWLRDHDENLLVLNLEDICDTKIFENLFQKFPQFLNFKEKQFKLDYKFDFTAQDDGVTLCVPLAFLKHMKEVDLSWLVPGLLEEKITLLLKGLPKKTRIAILPARIIQALVNEGLKKTVSLFEALSRILLEKYQLEVSVKELRNIALPNYMIFHCKVVDDFGKVLAFGNDLNLLYDELKNTHGELQSSEHPLAQRKMTEWDFGDLPLLYEVVKNKEVDTYYVALVDHVEYTQIQLFETRKEAEYNHIQGLARMFLLQLNAQIKSFTKSNLKTKKTLAKLYEPFGDYGAFLDSLFMCIAYAFLLDNKNDIRSQKEFKTILNAKANQFIAQCNQVYALIKDILEKYHHLNHRLLQSSGLEDKVIKDIEWQLSQLFMPMFIRNTPLPWLKRFPVYLKAIEFRLDKLPREHHKDALAMAEIEPITKAYYHKLGSLGQQPFLINDELLIFRWKIEEFRISLFAQTLGTKEPVSKVRLLKLLSKL